MQLCSVQMADALCGLLSRAHCNKPIAASAGASGICYYFSANNLQTVTKMDKDIIPHKSNLVFFS